MEHSSGFVLWVPSAWERDVELEEVTYRSPDGEARLFVTVVPIGELNELINSPNSVIRQHVEEAEAVGELDEFTVDGVLGERFLGRGQVSGSLVTFQVEVFEYFDLGILMMTICNVSSSDKHREVLQGFLNGVEFPRKPGKDSSRR